MADIHMGQIQDAIARLRRLLASHEACMEDDPCWNCRVAGVDIDTLKAILPLPSQHFGYARGGLYDPHSHTWIPEGDWLMTMPTEQNNAGDPPWIPGEDKHPRSPEVINVHNGGMAVGTEAVHVWLDAESLLEVAIAITDPDHPWTMIERGWYWTAVAPETRGASGVYNNWVVMHRPCANGPCLADCVTFYPAPGEIEQTPVPLVQWHGNASYLVDRLILALRLRETAGVWDAEGVTG